MVYAAVICGLSCVGLIVSALVKPQVTIKKFNFPIYWIAPLVGAILLLSCGLLNASHAWSGLTANTAVNPLKILVLFISMAILSIFLDEVGFFECLADKVLKRAGNSQIKLFVYLYFTVSVLTVFTSNDIVILTFTPFICEFCKRANVSPFPYLIGEFVAANTWSMALIIGNPTNIYLATSNGIAFVEYLKYMIVPTVFGGIVEFALLMFIFHKKLKEPVEHNTDGAEIKDKWLVIIGLVYLSACTILLAVSSYIGIEMWYVSLAFALALFVSVLTYKLVRKQKPTELLQCLKRAPWELIPFVLSMFILVLSLEEYGIVEKLANVLNGKYSILTYGASSYLACNLVNNIPMSVFFSAVANFADGNVMAATYASIVGSNLGAFLTPIGALAGIMWMNIVKKHGYKISFLKFVGYGAVISIPTLLATLGGLFIFF